MAASDDDAAAADDAAVADDAARGDCWFDLTCFNNLSNCSALILSGEKKLGNKFCRLRSWSSERADGFRLTEKRCKSWRQTTTEERSGKGKTHVVEIAFLELFYDNWSYIMTVENITWVVFLAEFDSNLGRVEVGRDSHQGQLLWHVQW